MDCDYEFYLMLCYDRYFVFVWVVDLLGWMVCEFVFVISL